MPCALKLQSTVGNVQQLCSFIRKQIKNPPLKSYCVIADISAPFGGFGIVSTVNVYPRGKSETSGCERVERSPQCRDGEQFLLIYRLF